MAKSVNQLSDGPNVADTIPGKSSKPQGSLDSTNFALGRNFNKFGV